MIVNLQPILHYANQNAVAVGSFNTPNLETIRAVISAAEELNVPVILMHAECHEYAAPLEVIGPLMVAMAKQAKVPVAVHLDHGEHLAYIEKALTLGFTSVMYDGSLLPYEENVRNTKKAVALARHYRASIEAEIGVLGGREIPSSFQGKDIYTDPLLAETFVKETDIDALACSFGTAHGFYKEKPKLDFPRIRCIQEKTHLPLVMHGGSGVSEEDYQQAIASGVRKINYYSYMSKAGVDALQKALQEKTVLFFHDLLLEGMDAMKENAKKAMILFSKKNL